MSPTATTALAELLAHGVELSVEGDRLRYRPPEAVHGRRRADLIRYKRDLLVLVSHLSTPPVPQGTWGQCASALLARIPDDDKRATLREAFEERVAICHHDRNLGIDEAERTALAGLCRAVIGERRVRPALPESAAS